MGIWPQQWKSFRKKPDGGVDVLQPDSAVNGTSPQRDQRREDEMNPSAISNAKMGGKVEVRNPRQQKKLQRDPVNRTFSFSPSRNDSIQVPNDIHRHHPVPSLPQGATLAASEAMSGANLKKATGQPNMEGQDGGQDGVQDQQRVPTLHKRSAQDTSRRKSNKKRKDDYDREAEIRAMSEQIPFRIATSPELSGRPMRKDTKRMRGINKVFPNPSSDVSLPTQESLHSSMSSPSEPPTKYQLKGIDLFSPHPTIRYFENPRYAPAASGTGVDAPGSQGRNMSKRIPFPAGTVKAHKRIDDIADDLDASGLRELMERDQRRRDRKKLSDRLKMERKIARKLEKQRAAELEAARNGTPPPKNLDRGVLGREVQGLAIDTGVASSVKRRASDASSRRRGKRPADYPRQDSATSDVLPPGGFPRHESLAPSLITPMDEHDDPPVIGTAQVARLSRANMTPPSSPNGHSRGVSSISQIMDLRETADVVPVQPVQPVELAQSATPNVPVQVQRQLLTEPEPGRSSLDTGSQQGHSWTAFFKRGFKAKREPMTPSFSNISRNSATYDRPASLSGDPPRESTSTIPRRTMSKFREDLPERPLSPPDSRAQSPEAEADIILPIQSPYPEKRSDRYSADTSIAEVSSRRHDTPTSGYRSLDPASRLHNETPTSGRRSNEIPSPEPPHILSQSLALIDSEGSWLSGRPRTAKQGSTLLPLSHPLHESRSLLQTRPKEFSESIEELGIAEDEYFSRLTPGPDDGIDKLMQRRISGNPMPSSDDEEGSSIASPTKSHKMKWGAVGRHASVVDRDEPRTKSREGLLNDLVDSEDDMREETPTELHGKGDIHEGEEESKLQRATSVEYKKAHVKHISTGSAKLSDFGEGKVLGNR